MLIFIGSIITFFKKLCGSLLNVRDCLHQCQFCCDVGLMLTSSRLHVTMKITKCLSLEFSLKIQGPKIFKGFLKMSYTYNQSQRLILRFCICAFYYTTHDIKSQNCSGRFNHCMYICISYGSQYRPAAKPNHKKAYYFHYLENIENISA